MTGNPKAGGNWKGELNNWPPLQTRAKLSFVSVLRMEMSSTETEAQEHAMGILRNALCPMEAPRRKGEQEPEKEIS